MTDLARQVHSDWFEIRDVFDNVFSIDEYLNLSGDDMEKMAKDLRLAVEGGVLEYKTVIANKSRGFIEALKFDTKQFADMNAHAVAATKLLYVILLQRLYCSGQMPAEKEKEQEELKKEYQETSIKKILEEFQMLVREDPGLMQKPEAKNILLQFKMYQKELEEMKKLQATIPKEKLPALLANFKNTLESITKKVEDNYNRILSEKTLPVKGNYAPGDIRAYDMSGLTKHFLRQAELAAEIRSRFIFANTERFQVREVIDASDNLLKELRQEISLEEKAYARLEPAGGAILVAKSFTGLIIRRIEKNIASRNT